MKISLDWDDTVTRDPALWMNFAALAKRAGHDVRVVTMRYERELKDVHETLYKYRVTLSVICTGREQKRPFCERLGWVPDVWIDDSPEFIVHADDPRMVVGKHGHGTCNTYSVR